MENENQEPTNKSGHMLPPEEPQLELTPNEEKVIASLDKVIDLNNAPQNGVLIVKISTEDHLYANNLQMGIIQRVLEPRREILRNKHLTVLFMAKDDDVSLLSEEDMNRAGWVKKDKPLIITP